MHVNGVSCADLWLFIKSRDVPLHHLFHSVVGIFFNRSSEKEVKTVFISLVIVKYVLHAPLLFTSVVKIA